ncbi:hypothetical protein [Streptomyces cinnamoneus]|uniref:Uncharacterized protein n=1 Tax=Streptomyces cinnamoneus TaxID=53446 RepID=A0A918WQ05_STRCJ|nr:hypothetical protein [Streptomyces cinnamoneus]GHC72414.1 hypothetical protein GCM10010507_59450 [Streptomyces cinnamoneus]
MCKQGPKPPDKGMLPAASMALKHATELQNRGFSRLVFELEDEATGLDFDVATVLEDGTPHYGYQLKDVSTIDAIKGAAKKAAKQLQSGTATQKVALLDVHQSIGGFNAKMLKEVEFHAKRANATFHLRFEDGSITVPPNGSVYP